MHMRTDLASFQSGRPRNCFSIPDWGDRLFDFAQGPHQIWVPLSLLSSGSRRTQTNIPLAKVISDRILVELLGIREDSIYSVCGVKGKAIPLRTLTGPEGSKRLRLPDFKTIGT
jgi:hypothetical protein